VSRRVTERPGAVLNESFRLAAMAGAEEYSAKWLYTFNFISIDAKRAPAIE
jgi:hypothetical protein